MTKLARYLAANGVTQVELARRSGVSRQTILDAVYERREPTLDTWAKLARALGCNVWDISEAAYGRLAGTL